MSKTVNGRKPYLKDECFLKDLGIHIRNLRKEKNITQEFMANSIGVDISQISRLERGILNASITLIKEVSIVLEIDLKDLFDFISLCENFDISSRILRRGVLPWEKYTGGFTVFNMKPLSIQLALEIKFISEQLLKADEVQWWIDQNVIEAAIRQIKYQGNSIKIHNAMSVRDDFIKMPVGNTETKKYLLDNLYSKSLNNSTIEGL